MKGTILKGLPILVTLFYLGSVCASPALASDLSVEVWVDKSSYSCSEECSFIEIHYEPNKHCYIRDIKAVDESGWILLFCEAINEKCYAEEYSRKMEISHPLVHPGKYRLKIRASNIYPHYEGDKTSTFSSQFYSEWFYYEGLAKDDALVKSRVFPYPSFLRKQDSSDIK